MTVRVRPARPDERVAVRSVLDAAMLETDAVASAVERERALVAVDDGHIVGALVLADTEPARRADELPAESALIDAIAVRRRRRDRGVGTALVAAAARRWRPLVARFDPSVRPFYESLGFEVETVERANAGAEVETSGERCRGILDGAPAGEE